MTLEEAKKIAAIAATADSGCAYCVGDIVDQLIEGFPEFAWSHVPYPDDDDDDETVKVEVAA